ncbi:MAG: hypothetical protein P8Z73_07045 [Desulfobacteraceae bacterium]|jgi:hypothetical protein
MEIMTIIDIFEDLAMGQRSGFWRKDLRRKADDFLQALFDNAKQKELETAAATQLEGEALVGGIDALYAATNALITGHDILAQLSSIDRRTHGQLPRVARAVAALREFTEIDFPAGFLPQTAAGGFEALASAEGDSEKFARLLLNLGLRVRRPSDRDLLRSLTETRLWTMNGCVLTKIGNAAPDANAASLEAAKAFRSHAEARTRDLRDAAYAAAARLAQSQADPVFFGTLWAAVDRWESWIHDEGAAALALIAAAATAAVQEDRADADRLARDAALGYDALRQGVAYDAGIRSALLAYAVDDKSTLETFAAASRLSLGAATLDLPRSSLSQAAQAADGEVVEIADIVREADIQAGGPAPRSVLLLGSPRGSQIRVFVPFSAVDAFGITSGVWIQVRGRMHPNGKDDIPGPVLQVRRIKRGEAAVTSFQDTLIHMGRREFELRPGGLDIIGGRLAGSQVTLNEMGLRRSVGG